MINYDHEKSLIKSKEIVKDDKIKYNIHRSSDRMTAESKLFRVIFILH